MNKYFSEYNISRFLYTNMCNTNNNPEVINMGKTVAEKKNEANNKIS